MALGSGVKLVLLAVIEIWRWEPRMLLAHGRHRECAGASVGLKGAEVVLESGHERDVLHALSPPGDFEHAPYDAGVRFDILLLRRAPDPIARQTCVGLRPWRDLPRDLSSSGVCMNVLHTVHETVAVAREPKNRSASFQERLRNASARNSRSSNDQRPDLHGDPSCFSKAKLRTLAPLSASGSIFAPLASLNSDGQHDLLPRTATCRPRLRRPG